MRLVRASRAGALGIILVSPLVCSAVAESFSVAFLGNSHTYFNDLPGLVQSLAAAAGETLLVSSSTPGGCSFSYPPNAHLLNPTSLGLLESGGWNYVVLQEQSQIPCIPYLRDAYMYPGAMALDSIAHASTPCCVTVFYMTWGHNHHGPWVETFDGYASPEFADYDAMQDSVAAAYCRLADSLGTPVAPVGIAWQNAYHGGIPLEVLFSPDEYHPALPGSYLTACVFYGTLFQESPIGLPFTAGLDPSLAQSLQVVADSTVMSRLAEWNIDPAMPFEAFEFTWSVPAEDRSDSPRRAVDVTLGAWIRGGGPSGQSLIGGDIPPGEGTGLAGDAWRHTREPDTTPSTARNTRTALWPPNPKELLTATATGR